MNISVIYTSPNKNGLTAACADAACQGIRQAGRQATLEPLNGLQVGMCQACEDGWGTCLTEHFCKVQDGFQALHARLCEADGLVIVTPVYWGEPSESAKALLDRLRRCEATRNAESRLAGKPVLAVAAAGGSGGGMITCLLSLEHWIHHVHARTFDLIPVNRWSREYKLLAIREAARSMVASLP